jgi:hypothetical protein
MSYSGMSRYDSGPLFGIDHGGATAVALVEGLAFPTDLDDVAVRLDAAARGALVAPAFRCDPLRLAQRPASCYSTESVVYVTFTMLA